MNFWQNSDKFIWVLNNFSKFRTDLSEFGTNLSKLEKKLSRFCPIPCADFLDDFPFSDKFIWVLPSPTCRFSRWFKLHWIRFSPFLSLICRIPWFVQSNNLREINGFSPFFLQIKLLTKLVFFFLYTAQSVLRWAL